MDWWVGWVNWLLWVLCVGWGCLWYWGLEFWYCLFLWKLFLGWKLLVWYFWYWLWWLCFWDFFLNLVGLGEFCWLFRVIIVDFNCFDSLFMSLFFIFLIEVIKGLLLCNFIVDFVFFVNLKRFLKVLGFLLRIFFVMFVLKFFVIRLISIRLGMLLL